MGYSEFVDWLAFYEMEPFGESRRDINTATLLAMMRNVNRGKRGKIAKPADFMPDWWKDGKKPRALAAKFRAATMKPQDPEKANGRRARDTLRRP